MLHPSPSGFAATTPSPSRVAELARDYERWHELGEQLNTAPGKKEDIERDQGIVGRHERDLIEELAVTPAQTLHDLGLKARVVREWQAEWFDSEIPIEAGDKLARTVIIELMEFNGLSPIPQHDFTPSEILPSFVEPPALPLPSPEPTPARTEAGPDCPAAALGLAFGQAVAMFDVLDVKRRNGLAESIQFLPAAMEAFEGAIGFVRATSAEGALAQIVMAMGGANVLAEHIPDGESDRSESSDCERRVRSCLWSVRRFLEQRFGLDARRFGADYYMPERSDDLGRLAKAASASSDTEAREA